jgi:hypothetical protein
MQREFISNNFISLLLLFSFFVVFLFCHLSFCNHCFVIAQEDFIEQCFNASRDFVNFFVLIQQMGI